MRRKQNSVKKKCLAFVQYNCNTRTSIANLVKR